MLDRLREAGLVEVDREEFVASRGPAARAAAGLRSDAWQQAAAVVALLGSILIAAIYVESVTGAVASGLTGRPGRLSS